MTETATVFISYGRSDGLEFAHRLARDLEDHRHRVWFDLNSIEKGGLFEVRIEQGIRDSHVVAAVMTQCSMDEHSVCRDEIVFALNEGKTIVPLRVNPDPTVRPTLLLARRNWVDFSTNYQAGLHSLLRFLAGDRSVLQPPHLPEVTGFEPLDFGPEIARYSSGFVGRQWITEAIEHWLRATIIAISVAALLATSVRLPGYRAVGGPSRPSIGSAQRCVFGRRRVDCIEFRERTDLVGRHGSTEPLPGRACRDGNQRGFLP